MKLTLSTTEGVGRVAINQNRLEHLMGSNNPGAADAKDLVKNSSLYREFQAEREEILKHKWIESEKCRHDLGREALADWICRFSDKFAHYWRRTHAYIPPESSPKN